LSGRDLVDDVRGGTGPQPAQARRGGLADLMLIGVVVLALGAAGYFGVTSLLGGSPPPAAGPAPAAAKAGVAQVAWTTADADRCIARARAAANAKESYGGPDGIANPAVTEGYAGLSTLIECHMTTKSTRFCDPSQKAALVSEINDYLGRTDLVMAGMVVEGAPMKVMGTLMGGEVDAGSGMYDMQHESTVKFMQGYQDKVTAALRKLARDGLLAPSDFSGFLGMGVPDNIKRMFGTTVAERSVCA
jgi:hypothetical protein